MYRIISGILDLERIQAGTPAFEEFGLEDLLGRVVVDLADHARTKGVTLELQLDERLPLILGDAQLLGQAISNLVDNAVKFTGSGGIVRVKAEASGEYVLIDVIDTGIGIPEDEIDRVFDRFFQGRKQAHLGGTGMGLALVKAIVDSHRGEINLESEEGHGTIAHVRLPISDELEF
jgi:two-component system phosphate regulon sensor histidine kinase PhoR